MKLDNLYNLEYSDYLRYLYFPIHNVSADMIFGFLQVFLVKLGSPVLRETAEEIRRMHPPKRCEYAIKEENKCLITLKDKNYLNLFLGRDQSTKATK